MPPDTTFYDLGGTVGRIVRQPGSLSIGIFDRRIGKWVHYPPIFSSMSGIGGGGHAPVIRRDAARRIIDSDPDAPNESGESPSA